MKKLIVIAVLVLFIPALLFAGGEQETAASEAEISVGVFVADSFGDRAFYDIALDGIKAVADTYDVETNQYEGRLEPDNFEPILTSAGKNNDLVFVLGFEAIDAMLKVASRVPDSIYVFLDSLIDSEDVVSLAYKDHEGTFVAGALAGLLTQRTEVKYINSDKVIGYVGGVDSPVMQRALWGYEQGLKYVAPDAEVEAIFVGSWVDPAKGKEANLALIEKGSDINFQYAGLSGEGGFNAAKDGAEMWVIGGGYDQRWLAPDHTIASVMKGVDTSMVHLTDMFLKGELEKGQKMTWGVKERGIYLTMSEDLLPEDLIQEVEAIQEKIEKGGITVTEFRD
jgi:basic membrane protein A